jgi:ATP-dependent Clp protease ATP-binding subunit ClpX
MIHIDTTNILFIFGGAFVGLDKIVARRIGSKGVGFTADTKTNAKEESTELIKETLPEDLQKYGMIPEFVGRIPLITTVDELTEDDLVRILTEPKNALVKQYKRMFAYEGVWLTFEDGALQEVAAQAIKHGTGARGLRAILEKVLMDTMFHIPSDPDIKEVLVTKASVAAGLEPTLVRKSA